MRTAPDDKAQEPSEAPAREPYLVPRPRGPVDLKLDGNEGAAPPASLLGVLAASAEGVELLRRYPHAGGLERSLAVRHGVAPERVVVTAGADDALDRCCRALLGPGRELVMPVPSFEMLGRYARLTSAAVCEVAWPDGAYPTEAVLAAVSPRTTLIAVVSPNNPTGAVARIADLVQLAQRAPGVSLLVDAAYGEFADEDLTDTALELPQAIVTRTLSKAWGLAGLRVGYAIASVEMAQRLRASGHPYAVAATSLALAQARLDLGDDDMRRYVAVARHERSFLRQRLVELGCDAPESQANFVLARPHRPTWLRDGLAGLGVAVRGWPEPNPLAGLVRITCPGNDAALERLGRALAAVLAPQAVLFDMDGVLADVRGSYRRAIIETAHHFGVALTNADVARGKAGGDANNDWLLTQRLMLERGTSQPLAAIVERFEASYREHAGSETLLPPRALLERLARRMPLGIVTGRPRAQAEAFLERMGIARVFTAMVCMDETPAKPDPAPVQLAIARLGVRSAWLVGDSPDDVHAARGAEVVPIGFVGAVAVPERAAVTDSLLDAGAARVLDDLTTIEEMLP